MDLGSALEFKTVRSSFGTMPQESFQSVTAIGLALLIFSSYNVAAKSYEGVTFLQQPDTAQMTTEIWRVTESDVLDELLAFHNRLASTQRDLPSEAMQVLTKNLWDLYE